MQKILETGYTWIDFIGIFLLLLLVYFGLKVSKSLLERFNLLGAIQKSVNNSLHYVLLVYEPVAVLILAGVFVLVAPLINGLIVLFLLILGGGYFKNYISGQFISRDPSVAKGKRLSVNKMEGVIYDLERFGVQLQTERGLHFVSYSKMQTDGYTILGGDQVGGIIHMKITADDSEKKINHKEYLMDLLFSTPYLDRIQKPILEVSEKNPNRFNARISLKEVSHLADLRLLLNELGYSCKILKN